MATGGEVWGRCVGTEKDARGREEEGKVGVGDTAEGGGG